MCYTHIDFIKWSDEERCRLLLSQCDRQLEIAKVVRKHSANEIGHYINNFTVKLWGEQQQLLRAELKKLIEKKHSQNVNEIRED